MVMKSERVGIPGKFRRKGIMANEPHLPIKPIRTIPTRRVVGVLQEPGSFDFYRLDCNHCVMTPAEGTPWPEHWPCEACSEDDVDSPAEDGKDVPNGSE